MKDWWIAFRSLKRKSRSAVAAIAVLAWGIGAVTATLSLGYILVAQPLPWKTAGRVMVIRQTQQAENKALTSLAPANFVDLRDSTHVFEMEAAWIGISSTLHGGRYPEALKGVAASASLFPLLGIRSQVGRWYGEEERHVTLISEELWQRQFDGRPDIVGKTIELDGQEHLIVGVLPRNLEYPDEVDFWVPLNSFAPLFSIRQTPLFSVLATLKPGQDLRTTQGELDFLAARLHQQYPVSDRGVRFVALPLRNALFGNVKPVLFTLLAASAFLLTVACINVMTILLSASLDRRREIAIQLALGASRLRLRAQFLREGLLLSFMAGVLGISLTPLLFHFLRQMMPQQSMLYGNLSLNGTAFLFATLTALACGVIFASVPVALQTRSEDLTTPLGEGGMYLGSRRSSTAWSLLMVSEVALTMALCIGAGLLGKSLFRLTHSALGFDPTNVLAVGVSLSRNPQSNTTITMAGELLRRLSALPGVESAGVVTFVPLSGKQSQYDVFLTPTASSPEQKISGISVESVFGDYFRTLRIPLRRGRLLHNSDGPERPKVCLINEAFADRYFAGIDPIGHTISVAKAEEKYQVVGIIGNVRGLSIAQPPSGTVFLPYAQAPWTQFDVVLRTTSNPQDLVSSAQRTTREVSPELVLIRITTIEDLLRNSLLDRRLRTAFLEVYAVLCLLLAGTGLYAIVTRAVQQQRREIALRMALGATRAGIFRLMLRQGMLPVAGGLGAGFVLSFSLSRMLGASLYGVSPNDFTTFLWVGVFVCFLGIGAISIPASRACSLDPAHWLRYQ